jgi:hypothetical protein
VSTFTHGGIRAGSGRKPSEFPLVAVGFRIPKDVGRKWYDYAAKQTKPCGGKLSKAKAFAMLIDEDAGNTLEPPQPSRGDTVNLTYRIPEHLAGKLKGLSERDGIKPGERFIGLLEKAMNSEKSEVA